MSSFPVNTPSFERWMKRHFTRDEMREIATHGAKSGFPGLIYYHQTAKLYRKYHEDIWDMLYEEAQSQGYEHPSQMIATFRGAENATDRARFENLLVWYAAEQVAARLTA